MTDQDSWEQEIRDLEESHLKPEYRRSKESMSKLLSDDYVEFGSSGTIHIDKKRIIEAVADSPPIHASLSDFRAKRLAADVVLSTYRTVKCDETGLPVKHSLRSSVWKHMDGRWQLVFHQGTPTAAPNP